MKSLSFLYRNARFADVDVVLKLAPHVQTNSKDVVTRMGPSTPNATVNSSQRVETPLTDVAADAASSRTELGADTLAKSQADETVHKIESTELKRFPGHLAVLCQSDFFDAQADFDAHASSLPSTSMPELTLTLEDAAHVPAVEAVIAHMYGCKETLSQLQQQQLVQAVQYADILQLGCVADEAVSLLQKAAESETGLTEEALQCLTSFQWPSCLVPLLPVLADSVHIDSRLTAVGTGICGCGRQQCSYHHILQQVLLTVLGNLETVWSDQLLSRTLLDLPVKAIKHLLSSDQLQVCSEDTVLYTVARFVDFASRDGIGRVQASPQFLDAETMTSMASKHLSALIRAPHLSDFQLLAQAVNTDRSAVNVLRPHQKQLRQLTTLKWLKHVSADMMQEQLLAEARYPQSWKLPPRHILPLPADGIELVWHVPVDDIKQACERCNQLQLSCSLCSPHLTAPLNGLAWGLMMEFKWDSPAADRRGVTIGASSPPFHPQNVYYNITGSVRILSCGGKQTGREIVHVIEGKAKKNGDGWRCEDLFGLGVLSGSWDKSAWVSKGWPSQGDIELKLTVGNEGPSHDQGSEGYQLGSPHPDEPDCPEGNCPCDEGAEGDLPVPAKGNEARIRYGWYEGCEPVSEHDDNLMEAPEPEESFSYDHTHEYEYEDYEEYATPWGPPPIQDYWETPMPRGYEDYGDFPLV